MFLAYLAPHLWSWFHEPTGFGLQEGINIWVPALCVALGGGDVLSGIRDLLAANGLVFFKWTSLVDMTK